MGRISRKKGASLGTIYLRYILEMIGAILIAVCCLFGSLMILINVGIILPANYAEVEIQNATATISNAEEVTQDLIPSLCKYAVFNREGKELSGNISKKYVKTAWKVTNNKPYDSDVYFYKVIERSNEYCVLQYRLIPQYKSAFLREHFISPQGLFTSTVLASGIIIILLFSVRFGKKMKHKLSSLQAVVEKIKEQELSYKVAYSGIKEIDDVISSMDEMKSALKDSLEKQWKVEQEKNQQMSALAHDIKTPLTVVRGNAELLAETSLTEEQKTYIDYIASSAVQIQNYVQTLIEVTKSVEGCYFQPTQIKIETLLQEIRNQSLGLANTHEIDVQWEKQFISESVILVFDQAVRAVMNIVINAVEHAPKGGIIKVCVEEQNGKLSFTIEDNGSGFSPEALKHGTEQFFMDDASRSGQFHYGIGLFVAKTIAERHGGELRLANSQELGGAKVNITF